MATRDDDNVSCSPLPVGGYDVKFIDSPPDSWECPVCLSTLRDPHLLSCCGVKICQSCLSRIVSAKDPCPKCRMDDFSTLLEKELQRSILSSRVKCSLGCPWDGELRHLDKHVSPLDEGECPLVTVTCKHGCGQVMKRVDVTEHEENVCPKQPIEVKLSRLQTSVDRRMINYEAEIHALKLKLTKQEKEMQDMKKELEKVLQPRPKTDAIADSSSSSNVVFSNFSPDVLLLLPKLKTIPGVRCYPGQGSVEVVSDNHEEREQMISSFQDAYQRIVQNSQFKSGTLELPPSTQAESVITLVNQYNDKYHQCHFSYDPTSHSLKIVTLSSRQFDQAMKLLKRELSGEQPSSSTPNHVYSNTKLKLSYSQCLLQPATFNPSNPIPSSGMPASAKSPSLGFEYDECPICLSNVTNPKRVECCKTVFCTRCIDRALEHSSLCPMCKQPQKPLKGNQPKGTMNHEVISFRLPGFFCCNTIKITYHFSDGTQGPNHPSPGQRYYGTTRTAYLPGNNEGRHVLKLLEKAFNAGLVFTIGRSAITGQDNTVMWNDIHHKTNTNGGSFCNGYPDPSYLTRVKDEMKAKGIY